MNPAVGVCAWYVLKILDIEVRSLRKNSTTTPKQQPQQQQLPSIMRRMLQRSLLPKARQSSGLSILILVGCA
jgi:hypothetical protein